jgi:hypothetical protein
LHAKKLKINMKMKFTINILSQIHNTIASRYKKI